MRITVFDLESTALNGNWGRILAAGFHDLGSKEVEVYRRDEKPWRGRNRISDEKLAAAIRDRLNQADILVGWNSIRFDLPLINTRLVANGDTNIVQAGVKYARQHLDLMYYARGTGLNIGSSKLDNVAKWFELDVQKTDLDGETWQLAAAGDKDAMDSVVEHCVLDVKITGMLVPKLSPFVKKLQFTWDEVWPFVTEVPSRRS